VGYRDRELNEDVPPEVRQRVTASFDQQGLTRHLGARLTEMRRGQVQVELPRRPEVTQQHDYFHAGRIATSTDG
jgi:acyl-coenzyme A thioesterase PaaI-like protein